MFGATNIVKSNDKERSVYSGYGITFEGGNWWSFSDGTVRNVIVFAVDNSSSSHIDNRKNNFLILDLGPTFGINGSFGSPGKKFRINFIEPNTKFCWGLHYNADIFMLMEKK